MRGHVVVATIELLRGSNLFQPYRDAILARGASELLHASPNDWVSLRLMLAHMEALGTLGLNQVQQVSFGTELGKRAYGTILATLMRLASHLGATPWTALRQANKVWSRMYDGGALVAYQEDARTARLEWWRNPLSSLPAYQGITIGAALYGLSLFAGGDVRPQLLGSADSGTSFGARFVLPRAVAGSKPTSPSE